MAFKLIHFSLEETLRKGMDTPVMAEVLNQVEREAGKYCSSRLQAFVGNQSVKVPLVENSE